MTVSRCRKLWCPKCWNQLVGNFHVYLHAKNKLFQSLSFLTYCKEISNLLFWASWICLATHLKWYYPFEETFELLAKNQRFPWYITKILQTCYFGNFGQAWLGNTQSDTINLWKTFLLMIDFIPPFFRRCCKDKQTSYFGCFGHPNW